MNLKDNVGILKIQGDVSTYYATLTNGKWNLTKINGADNMSFYYAFPLENRTVTGLYPASYVILNNKLIFTNYSDTQNLPIVEFDFSNAANIKVNHLNINTTQKFLNINIMQKKDNNSFYYVDKDLSLMLYGF
ncbi:MULTISPECIES: hypothetical protein [unclassified Spiroplasma]|uniref:hypothetical protein n=1 Tax=unclassified Spiroplasma TaxID=2637901 RepID=UPI0030CC1A49